MFKIVSLVVVFVFCISVLVVVVLYSVSGIILIYDLNKDELFLLEEFVDVRCVCFNVFDINKDGVFDESEYVYEWEGKVEKWLVEDRKVLVK